MTRLTERVCALLAALEPPDSDAPAPRPTAMPGLKPATKRRAPTAAPPARKRRARGYGRRRMRPTARQMHAYAHCPHCQTPLCGGAIKRTREVIDVVPNTVLVTEHVYVERRCSHCGGRWLPSPEMAGVVVGQGRLGWGCSA